MSHRLVLALLALSTLAPACTGLDDIALDSIELRGVEDVELRATGQEGHFAFEGTRGDDECSGTVEVQPYDDPSTTDIVLECLPPGGAHTSSLPAGASHEVVAQARRCDGGIAEACTNLAQMFLEGRGVPKDRARANLLFTQACASHDGAGCYRAAKALEAAGATSRSELTGLFVDACDQGHGPACGEAAQRLYNADAAAEIPTMARMARKGCEADDRQACLVLGILMAYGIGMPSDIGEARRRLMQACSADLEAACDLVESL